MKKHINRNIIWAEAFANQLSYLNVRHVCISPGSRSTPLTLAFANNDSFTKHIVIDERSAGFFALGIAKQTDEPVVVVTTSGTAVTELHSAIAEAYQQRIPLIVCTADRPPELQNCGSNQTINQRNIFKNNIRKYWNPCAPELTADRFYDLKSIAADAVAVSCTEDKGPVHINFPFAKPLEPQLKTDIINEKDLEKFLAPIGEKITAPPIPLQLTPLAVDINNSSNGLIICGQGNYDPDFAEACFEFSKRTGFPIIADGASSYRFGNHKKENLIVNYDALFRSAAARKALDAGMIIQFNYAPTSKWLLKYIEESSAKKVLVNTFGDLLDPSRTADVIINAKPSDFCKKLTEKVDKRKKQTFAEKLSSIDSAIDELKENTINNTKPVTEGRIINELISAMPDKANLMVSNSLPVRDLDFFAGASEKQIKVYANRGASGIDGITSTAAGIAVNAKEPTVLLTGDLAFLHDTNGMWLLNNESLPLVIVLVDNNGGAVFNLLPVAEDKNFDKYFVTPHNTNFEKLVEAHNGTFVNITSWKNFAGEFGKALKRKTFTVLQLETDAPKSMEIRKAFWKKTAKEVEKLL